VPLVVDGNHFAGSVSAERLQLLYSVRHYDKTITHLNALLDALASLKYTSCSVKRTQDCKTCMYIFNFIYKQMVVLKLYFYFY